MGSLTTRITNRFVGAYDENSASVGFRARRWTDFASTFPDLSEYVVLDLGGDARSWRLSGLRPKEVVLLNTFAQEPQEPWMRALEGDGCDLPAGLPEVDLVFSNSVIEHVGGHWRRERFASNVRQLAARHWVQTPYRYFPIEPHYLIPFAQQLPLPLRTRLIKAWPVGHFREHDDFAELLSAVMQHELLTRAEMRHYFPGSELRHERFAGLTKSLIAVAT